MDPSIRSDARWATAVADMAKIITSSPVPLGDAFGLNTPVISETEVLVNGMHAGSHETFHFGETGFTFCKTAYKPYDIVVTACLAVAKEVFGDDIDIGSDGNADDWENGVKLAGQVLGRPIENPLRRFEVKPLKWKED